MDELKEYFHIAEIVKRPSRASFCLPGILFFGKNKDHSDTDYVVSHKNYRKKHKR